MAALITFATCFAFALLGTSPFGSPSEAFEVQISVNEVQNLYGFDLKLLYNTDCLDLVEVSPELPWELNMIARNEINEALGTYRIAAMALAPSPPFEGSTTLATLTFLRTGDGETSFSLADVALVDQSANTIPCIVNGLAIDALPVHDIAVTGIHGIPRGVYQGDEIDVSVTVENEGNFVETFDVTLYADHDKSTMGDEYVIGTQTVTDIPGKTTQTMHFIWDTDNVIPGHYWLSAEATAVPEEVDTSDNLLKFGDWIGGIYPPPQVRRAASTGLNLLASFTLLSMTLVGTLGIKKLWWP